jgi:hypothetical protein
MPDFHFLVRIQTRTPRERFANRIVAVDADKFSSDGGCKINLKGAIRSISRIYRFKLIVRRTA